MELDMSDIILEDAEEIEVIKEEEGQKVGPNWQPGNSQTYLVNAAVFYLSSEDLEEYEGGKYTTQDIVFEVIEGYQMINKDTGQAEDVEIEKEDKILYDQKTFQVDEDSNFTTHSNYYEFIAVKEVVDDD